MNKLTPFERLNIEAMYRVVGLWPPAPSLSPEEKMVTAHCQQMVDGVPATVRERLLAETRKCYAMERERNAARAELLTTTATLAARALYTFHHDFIVEHQRNPTRKEMDDYMVGVLGKHWQRGAEPAKPVVRLTGASRQGKPVVRLASA